MNISFEGPAVMVRDMAACRRFYEELLGQKVLFSVGEAYTAYAGKFSLWEAGGAHAMVFGQEELPAKARTDGEFELYFETEELDEALKRMRGASVVFIHDIREQPWGQRCFRVRDPEGRIVELGEPMAVVAKRYLSQGMSVQEVCRRTMLPIGMVEALIAGQ